jgi:hypothetical protein
MSSRVQFKSVAGSFGTSHSVTFDSTVTAGNTAVLIVYHADARTISNVATSGNVQSISASDASVLITSTSNRYTAFSLGNCPAGVTGFTFNTDANTTPSLMVFELNGVGAYAANGSRQQGFVSQITVTVTTTGTDGQLVGGMSRGAAFSSNGANTVSENTNNPSAVINDTALGAAGSKSLVMNLSTSGSSNGAAFWYQEGGGGGGPASYYLGEDLYL